MAGSIPKRWHRVALLGVVATSSLACDLQTKAWAWETLRPSREPMVLIDPHFELAFAFNTGSAFSIVDGSGAGYWALLFVGLGVLAYLAWLAAKMPTRHRLGFVALGLVLAGAVGNLHDRIVRVDELGRHGVVDFMKINYPWGGSWPTFNVADVLLLVGAALLLVHGWRGGGLVPERDPTPDPSPS